MVCCMQAGMRHLAVLHTYMIYYYTRLHVHSYGTNGGSCWLAGSLDQGPPYDIVMVYIVKFSTR